MDLQFQSQLDSEDILAKLDGGHRAFSPPSQDFLSGCFMLYVRSNIKQMTDGFKKVEATSLSLDHTFKLG